MTAEKASENNSTLSATGHTGADDSFFVPKFNENLLEEARRFFAQPCEFLAGVVNVASLPADTRTEVAFAGRSNVGKSSLINALVRRKALARISNTPGRTRELNYFTITDRLYLVDMPGYGYARASKNLVEGWTNLIEDYLKGRTQLRRLFLLIDSRHGFKDSDHATMELMDVSAVSYQIVLTKTDKLKKSELIKVIDHTLAGLARHPAAHPLIIPTSSRKGDGIDLLQTSIFEMIDFSSTSDRIV